MTNLITSIAVDVTELADLRQIQAANDVTLSVLKEGYMATEEYQEYQSCLAAQQANQLNIEACVAKIKAQAIEEYNTFSTKDPHPAVKIRILRKIDYPIGVAIDWCKEHLLNAFKFDDKLFDKHARAIEGTSPIDFVTFTDEPQVTIASDLSKWSTL